MLTQAIDFRDESRALYALLESLPDSRFAEPTLFKAWTINDILAHLDLFNRMADESLRDAAAFEQARDAFKAQMAAGTTMRALTKQRYAGMAGQALLAHWREAVEQIAERWVDVDPRQRLPWFGPSMSARSSMTARLMETWAHGQAAYDLCDVERQEHDRIKNIVVLGVNTFGLTFSNRGEDIPGPMPGLALTAPSGQIWTWNEANEAEHIEGPARDFCQVVTQVRNVADTDLSVRGDVATRWMSIAQCFAGSPEIPPAPGSRRRQVR